MNSKKEELEKTQRIELTKDLLEKAQEDAHFTIDDQGENAPELEIVRENVENIPLEEAKIENTRENIKEEDIRVEAKPFEKEETIREENKKKFDKDAYRGYSKNLYPNFYYAGFGARFMAFIIDSIIGLALARILIYPISLVLPILAEDPKIHSLASNLIALSYWTLSTYITNGQSLGKMILGIRVVSFKEERLSFVSCFIREFIGKFILQYGILGLLYLMVLFTDKKQHLVDQLADTSVVIEEARESFKERFC